MIEVRSIQMTTEVTTARLRLYGVAACSLIVSLRAVRSIQMTTEVTTARLRLYGVAACSLIVSLLLFECCSHAVDPSISSPIVFVNYERASRY